MSLDAQLARAFLTEHPAEAALALERMPGDRRASAVREMPVEAAAALAHMISSAAAACLSRLTAAEAAPALEALPIDAAIAALRRLPNEDAGRLLDALPREKQEALRRVLRYPEGTAAALMDPAVFALPADITVAEARLRLRREARWLLHYLFVVDRSGRLVGVLDIPELMRASARDAIRTVMRDQVGHLPAWTPSAAVRAHPGWRSFHAMPVTDDDGRLIGAIRYQTLRQLEQEVDAGMGAQLASVTAGALGELFHLGVAGLVEGVAAVATLRSTPASRSATAVDGGVR